MSDIHAQTLQLATALKEVFPELTFSKDVNTGIVTINTAVLSITVAPFTPVEALNENGQPLGASSEPAYKSADTTPVPVMSHAIK